MSSIAAAAAASSAGSAAAAAVPSPVASVAPAVAPPILFVSPWPQSQIEQTTLIARGYGETPMRLKFDDDVLVILLRMQDRIAHELLRRAHLGLNGAAAGVAGEDAVDAHSIVFPLTRSTERNAFESEQSDRQGLDVFFSLHLHVRSAVKNATDLFDDVCEEGGESRLGEMYGQERGDPLLRIPLGHRWVEDFATSMRMVDPLFVLHPAVGSTRSLVALCAAVERLTYSLLCPAELLLAHECVGEMRVVHLWDVVQDTRRSPGLRELAQFLPVDWTVDWGAGGRGAGALRAQSRPSSEGDNFPDVLDIVSLLSAPVAEAQRALNESSWFHDSLSVQTVARQCARGEFVEADISRLLREHHVRPLRYFGVDHVSRFVPQWKPSDPPLTSLQHAHGHASFAFALDDLDGVEWNLLLRYAPKTRSAFLYMLSESLCGTRHILNHSTEARVGSPAAAPGGIPWRYGLHLRDQQPHAPENIPELQYTPHRPVVPPPQTPEKLRQMRSAQAELVAAMEAATNLAHFSLYGPTLFTHNHSLAARERFTAAVIDEAFLAADLQLLPAVLSAIIAQFACVDQLPFVQALADKQMRSPAAGGGVLKPVAEAMYVGQLELSFAVEALLEEAPNPPLEEENEGADEDAMEDEEQKADAEPADAASKSKPKQKQQKPVTRSHKKRAAPAKAKQKAAAASGSKKKKKQKK